MHSLPLNPDKEQTEWEIIQSVAKNNNFPQHMLLKLNRQILHKVNNKKTSKNDKKNLDNIYIPHPKDQKNYQLVKKYEYRHGVQDYNNISPSHKTHSTNPVTRTLKKWNIQNYVQDLPHSICRADKSKHKIKIRGTHTVH